MIEAGFPATPGDSAEVARVAKSVGQTTYDLSVWNSRGEVEQKKISPVIAGLCRTTPGDIGAAWEAVKDARRARIHTFVSTDPEHMAKKFPGKSPKDVLEMGRVAVEYAKRLTQNHSDGTVEFSAEAASTTDPRYLEQVIKAALVAGADVINVPDTVGQREPFWMQKFYAQVIDWVLKINPSATISAHNHNDLGLAVANTHMLVQAASDYAAQHNQKVRVQLETTLCGLGERAGNTDVFPLVAGLFKFCSDSSVLVSWRFNPARSVASAQDIMKQASYEVDRQSPVVGADTNVHRSGIHSDGVLKGGHTIYTPFDPTFWGHASDAVHEDGKYQGRRGREAAKVLVNK